MSTTSDLTNTISSINQVNGALSNTPSSPGFNATPVSPADGNGLPSSKVVNFRTAQFGRDIIHFFIPEFGIVKMFVNPAQIVYKHSKLINKEQTKGGFTLQYFGEDLSTLTISGTTGSSGIEGINVLYEMYRAEQYAFDAIGLSLAADNAAIGAANQMISGIGNAVGSATGNAVGGSIGGSVGGLLGSGIAQGIFGTNGFTALAPRNIASLASLAFGVELYYSGEIHRGYFKEMSVTESANNIGLFEYNITFIRTQRRGYRVNGFPWQRSAVNGASDNGFDSGVPWSYDNLG
jgi:hypothetical protein